MVLSSDGCLCEAFGCGFLSSNCLNNSGCLGLSGLNLTEGTDTGGGAGDLIGCGGLVWPLWG